MIRFILNKKSSFDCVLKIKDIYGTKEYLLSVLNGKNYLDADFFEQFTDVVITSADFSWTYAKTHEEYCGPYFYKR